MAGLPHNNSIDRPKFARFRRHFIWAGLCLIVIGILSITFPFIFSILTKFLIGIVFVMVGAVFLYESVWSRTIADATVHGVIAVLYLVLGIYLLAQPTTGLVGMTIFITATLLIEGLGKMYFAQRRRPRRGWAWMMASGIAAVFVGIMLMVLLPNSAHWAIGMALGANAMATGVALTAIAYGMRT